MDLVGPWKINTQHRLVWIRYPGSVVVLQDHQVKRISRVMNP